jgi:hypothetical protein
MTGFVITDVEPSATILLCNNIRPTKEEKARRYGHNGRT